MSPSLVVLLKQTPGARWQQQVCKAGAWESGQHGARGRTASGWRSPYLLIPVLRVVCAFFFLAQQFRLQKAFHSSLCLGASLVPSGAFLGIILSATQKRIFCFVLFFNFIGTENGFFQAVFTLNVRGASFKHMRGWGPLEQVSLVLGASCAACVL